MKFYFEHVKKEKGTKNHTNKQTEKQFKSVGGGVIVSDSEKLDAEEAIR